MGDAELMEKLRLLPPERQAEVYDFVEFLVARCCMTSGTGNASGKSEEGVVTRRDELVGMGIRPPRPISEEEIERIFQAARGAWGPRTLEETEALIRERRRIDWGDDEETP